MSDYHRDSIENLEWVLVEGHTDPHPLDEPLDLDAAVVALEVLPPPFSVDFARAADWLGFYDRRDAYASLRQHFTEGRDYRATATVGGGTAAIGLRPETARAWLIAADTPTAAELRAEVPVKRVIEPTADRETLLRLGVALGAALLPSSARGLAKGARSPQAAACQRAAAVLFDVFGQSAFPDCRNRKALAAALGVSFDTFRQRTREARAILRTRA